MTALLALIPARLYEYALVALVCGLIACGFIRHERAIGSDKVEAVRQAEHAALAIAVTQAAASAATETTRRIVAIQGVVHDTQVSAARVAADAASAAVARDALRVQLDAVVRRSRVPGNPASAAGSTPVDGGDPIGVLADVLGRADARADIVELLADERRIRAAACEASFDSLTPQPPKATP